MPAVYSTKILLWLFDLGAKIYIWGVKLFSIILYQYGIGYVNLSQMIIEHVGNSLWFNEGIYSTMYVFEVKGNIGIL